MSFSKKNCFQSYQCAQAFYWKIQCLSVLGKYSAGSSLIAFEPFFSKYELVLKQKRVTEPCCVGKKKASQHGNCQICGFETLGTAAVSVVSLQNFNFHS